MTSNRFVNTEKPRPKRDEAFIRGTTLVKHTGSCASLCCINAANGKVYLHSGVAFNEGHALSFSLRRMSLSFNATSFTRSFIVFFHIFSYNTTTNRFMSSFADRLTSILQSALSSRNETIKDCQIFFTSHFFNAKFFLLHYVYTRRSAGDNDG